MDIQHLLNSRKEQLEEWNRIIFRKENKVLTQERRNSNMYRMITHIKRLFLNKYIGRKTKSLIHHSAILNSQTILEGMNKIGNVNLTNTSIGLASYVGSGNVSNSTIGRFCSLGSNINIISANHPISFVSTYPGFYKTSNKNIFIVGNDIAFKEFKLLEDGKAIHIGHDVWVGNNVTFLGGLTIGNGSIIGANSLVTKDVAPYSIVGGVPAKLIRYRFSKDVISKFQTLNWWNWDIKKIVKESKFFGDVETFLNSNSEFWKD